MAATLKQELKKSARSFYLSLKILPPTLREPVALAYVLARRADTIADRPDMSAADKLRQLKLLQEKLPQDTVALKPPIKETVERIVTELIRGMENTLAVFPGNSPRGIRALPTLADLDRYCLEAAGVVGPFWSKVLAMHFPDLHHLTEGRCRQWSEEYGKGLQLINVLKDIHPDYQTGRCYLPAEELAKMNISPLEIGNPHYDTNLRPLINRLILQALFYLENGHAYIATLPGKYYRLRLATLWPLWLGLATLARLAPMKNLLAADARTKIRRRTVYRLLAKSFVFVLSNKLLAYHLSDMTNRIKSHLQKEIDFDRRDR